MASIFQRGKRGTWWIKYYVDGKQVYRSLKTTVAREAERIKKLIEGQEASGDLVAPSRIALAEFLEAYCRFLSTIRTPKSYKNDCSVLRIAFGPVCEALKPGSCVNRRWISTKRRSPQQKPARRKPGRPKRVPVEPIGAKFLEDVTAGRIEEFISRRIREDGISPKTANHTRSILHRMFNHAIRTRGFVAPDRRQPNPAAGVERRSEPARTIRFLELHEIDEQLEVVQRNPTLHAMVATYIYAGLRREAATWLTTKDVDLDRRLIHVRAKTIDGEFWQPKTKKNRVVPISEDLLAILRDYQPERSGPWFFPSSSGRRWDPDNFSQELRKINLDSGLPWSCLDYRHTFGSHLAQKGESLYKIAELMGNSPGICQKHYAALVPHEMREEVEFGSKRSDKESSVSKDETTQKLLAALIEKVDRLERQDPPDDEPRLRVAR